MSTDFSIRPVGAPAETPVVQPVSQAAKARSRPSCRPARASRRPTPAWRRATIQARAMSYRIRLHRPGRGLDRLSGRRWQTDGGAAIPDEAVLRRRAYFHALDLTKSEPTRFSPPTARPRSASRGDRGIEIGRPVRIGDDVLDLRRSGLRQGTWYRRSERRSLTRTSRIHRAAALYFTCPEART